MSASAQHGAARRELDRAHAQERVARSVDDAARRIALELRRVSARVLLDASTVDFEALATIAARAGELADLLAGRALARRRPATAAPATTYAYDVERGVLCLPDGGVVDLARRGPLRRILEALLMRRESRDTLTTVEVFAIGWDGQKAAPEAAANRVYNAISTLRGLGLGAALEGTSEGYRLSALDAWVVTRSLTRTRESQPSTGTDHRRR